MPTTFMFNHYHFNVTYNSKNLEILVISNLRKWLNKLWDIRKMKQHNPWETFFQNIITYLQYKTF